MRRDTDESTAEAYRNGRRCTNCGAYVSRRFSRVFGNNDDEVYACLECTSATEVRNGGTVS